MIRHLVKYRDLLSSPHVWIMLFLGFSSGLPLALTGGTLQAWLTMEGLSLKAIGIFGLVALPYIYKFLWSPLMDRFVPPFLGRRRGWILLTQIGLVITIAWMSFVNPRVSPWLLASLALVTAFASASQDIAIDAYRTDILTEDERGLGSSMFLGGWRLGAMVSGGIALIIAEYIGWHITYLLLALCMLLSMIATMVAPKPAFDTFVPQSLTDAVILPFKDFFQRRYAIILLLFIIFYKLPDAFAASLMSTFLIRAIGFSLATVGSVFKVYGLIATLIGVFLGGLLLPKLKFFNSLLLFGLLQAFSNLIFISLIYFGKNYSILVLAISVENITGGMATVVFMAFLMALCDHHYTATQYALFSALAALGRVLLGPFAGWTAQNFGWITYYLTSLGLVIPGLLILIFLRSSLPQILQEAKG